MRRATGIGMAAVAGVLLLAGCSTSPEARPGPVHMPSKAAPSPHDASTGSEAAPHASQAPATTTTSAEAVEVAVAATRLFCRPRLGRARWIGDLDRVLTLEAASVYATVDPGRVRCTRVELPARAGEGDGFTQIVAVPTDGSTYRVTVSRSSLSAPWLVFRITPGAAR